MKENSGTSMRKVIKDTGLFIQFVLSALLLIFVVVWAFTQLEIVGTIIYLLLSLVFLVMGYNNYRIYKRKSFTAIYLLMSLYFFANIILGLL